jgi:hypothetical protein
MKYILILWVCSFIEGNGCLPPVKYPILYDSWYECSRAAHQESLTIMAQMGYKNINQYQVGMKYNCKLVETH